VQIVRSAHPIVTIWSMNSGENALGSIEDCEAEDALVARLHLDVQVRRLPVGGAAFLGAIATGASLGEAAGSAAAAHPEFDLATNLAGLVGAGLATKLRCTSTRKDIAP
jgi:hypothetical protein